MNTSPSVWGSLNTFRRVKPFISWWKWTVCISFSFVKDRFNIRVTDWHNTHVTDKDKDAGSVQGGSSEAIREWKEFLSLIRRERLCLIVYNPRTWQRRQRHRTFSRTAKRPQVICSNRRSLIEMSYRAETGLWAVSWADNHQLRANSVERK